MYFKTHVLAIRWHAQSQRPQFSVQCFFLIKITTPYVQPTSVQTQDGSWISCVQPTCLRSEMVDFHHKMDNIYHLDASTCDFFLQINFLNLKICQSQIINFQVFPRKCNVIRIINLRRSLQLLLIQITLKLCSIDLTHYILSIFYRMPIVQTFHSAFKDMRMNGLDWVWLTPRGSTLGQDYRSGIRGWGFEVTFYLTYPMHEGGRDFTCTWKLDTLITKKGKKKKDWICLKLSLIGRAVAGTQK